MTSQNLSDIDAISLKKTSEGIVLKVFIQPRSSKNEIIGPHGDALKVKLTAPPVDGAANTMGIAYLAKCFDVPKSSVEILSGHTGRMKQVLIKGINDLDRFRSHLKSLISG